MRRTVPSNSKRNLGIFLLVVAGFLAAINLFESGLLSRSRSATTQTEKTLAGLRSRVLKLSQEEKLRLATDRVLDNFGINVYWIKYRGNDREVRVPASLPPVVIYQALHDRIRQLGGQVEQGTEDLRSGVNALRYAFSGKTLGTIRLIPDAKLHRRAGRIAIIIDDFGHNLGEVASDFLDISLPVTYSIIPGLPYSQTVAATLQKNGKPMMIHLPMEPLEAQVEDDGYTLFTRLAEPEIRRRVKKAIGSLPHARGLNNHMGSLATVSDALLRPALEQMREARLFFVDSRTNPNTHAYSLARQMGLDTALNDTFLDTQEDRDWVAGKLLYLADLAAQRGFAIGIGHPNATTLRVLQELGPTLQQRGFEFVPVTELMRQPAAGGLAMRK